MLKKIPLYFLVMLLSFGFLTPAVAGNSAVPFSAVEIKQLVGHYSTAYGYFHVRQLGKNIVTQSDGKRIYLVKKQDGLIYPTYRLLGFIPISKSDNGFQLEKKRGKLVVMVHYKDKNGNQGKSELGEKFQPINIPHSWKQRLGNYRLIKDNKPYKSLRLKLHIKNNVLLGTRSDNDTTYPFMPRSGQRAYVPGSEKNLMEVFIKNKQLFLRRHKVIYPLKKA